MATKHDSFTITFSVSASKNGWVAYNWAAECACKQLLAIGDTSRTLAGEAFAAHMKHREEANA